MSRDRRRDAPMPATTAGLLRFFEDSTAGIQIQPLHVIVFSIAFIIVSVILNVV